MKITSLLIFVLISVGAFAQNLTCENFNEGTFIGTNPQLPGIEWKVNRTQNYQTEILTKVPQEYIDMGIKMDTVYGKFEIIDKCTYRFLYDESKMKLDENQTSANRSGGIMVEIIKIEGKCFFYRSKAMVDNNEFVLEGQLCKEEQ